MTTIEATSPNNSRRVPNPFSAASSSLRRLSQDKRRTVSPSSAPPPPPPQRQIAKVPSSKSVPPLQHGNRNRNRSGSERRSSATREFSYVSDDGKIDEMDNSLSTVPSLATPIHSHGLVQQQQQVTRPNSHPVTSAEVNARNKQTNMSHSYRHLHQNNNNNNNNSKVPLWIPIDERLHWIADTPSLEYVSSGSMSSTQQNITNRHDTTTSSSHNNVPLIDPTMLHANDSDYHYQQPFPTHAMTMRQRIKRFQLFPFGKNKGDGLPSARRSFRSNKKGFARLFRRRDQREMENRMSVDRNVYNNNNNEF